MVAHRDKTLAQIQNTSTNSKTLTQIQNTSTNHKTLAQIPKHLHKCKTLAQMQNTSTNSKTLPQILVQVFWNLCKCFVICGSVLWFVEVFCPYEPPY